MSYLVVGLGNPGEKYEKTRHNAGWLVIDGAFPDLVWQRNSYASAGTAKESGFLFVKPTTFMNDSGVSVGYFTAKEGYDPDHVVVIYDDIDLAIGTFKISFDRGSGGHNGIKSIEAHLGSREFIRIRIGISKLVETTEQGSMIISKPNVLGNFEPGELEALKELAPTIKRVLETIQSEGREKAMTVFNSRDNEKSSA